VSVLEGGYALECQQTGVSYSGSSGVTGNSGNYDNSSNTGSNTSTRSRNRYLLHTSDCACVHLSSMARQELMCRSCLKLCDEKKCINISAHSRSLNSSLCVIDCFTDSTLCMLSFTMLTPIVNAVM
jgi:hypothetical protein